MIIDNYGQMRLNLDKVYLFDKQAIISIDKGEKLKDGR